MSGLNSQGANAWSKARVAAAGSTNATSLKARAAALGGFVLINTSAALKFVKFYDKASAPTVGTDVPAFTIPLPANGIPVTLNSEAGIDFGTGLAYAITGAVGDADATAVSANDVHGVIYYA